MFNGRDEWEEILRRCEDSGCDGVELNFGCPHGMCERGMGSAVGQEPKVLRALVEWVRASTTLPVIAKLTPNITDITEPAMAAQEGGATAVSLINTIQSLIGVDLDRLVPLPRVNDASTHGGYCGPAVRPIALRMVGELGRYEPFKLPVSGIGGVGSWRDAAEFLALGARNVQVCTAVMHHGFRVIEDLTIGLSDYLDAHGFRNVEDLVGRALPAFKEWGDLDLNHHVVAKIDPATCIGCQVCYVACRDGAHQCIHLDDTRVPHVDEVECVGCNLCALVCPVDGCIEMVPRRHAPGPESWNDRVAAGRDRVPGGLTDLE
jgi:dihydropyrimidine dehydrogenase (NAD+) subunit PreA